MRVSQSRSTKKVNRIADGPNQKDSEAAAKAAADKRAADKKLADQRLNERRSVEKRLLDQRLLEVEIVRKKAEKKERDAGRSDIDLPNKGRETLRDEVELE